MADKKEETNEPVKEEQATAVEEVAAKAPTEGVDDEVQHIVRIAGKDLKGTMDIPRALTHIKGVSHSLAQSISKIYTEKTGIDKLTKLGLLTEKQIEELEEIVLNPGKNGIPTWMLNRQKEPLTGNDNHLTSHDLDFAIKTDVGNLKKTRSYKGVRHSVGLTVRGQRTRTSGRKGTTVGVIRRKGTKGSGK